MALIEQALVVTTFHAKSVHGNRDMLERSLYNPDVAYGIQAWKLYLKISIPDQSFAQCGLSIMQIHQSRSTI